MSNLCVATVGAEYQIENKPWTVAHVGNDKVKLRCVGRGYEEEEFSYFDFNAAVYEGDIKIPKLAKNGVPLPDLNFVDLPSATKSTIYRCNAYVRKYAVDKHKRSITTSQVVDTVAKKLEDPDPPSTRTVERWYSKWLQLEEHWMAFIPASFLKNAKVRMDHCRNDLLIQIIEDKYLVFGSNFSYRDIQDAFETKLNLPEYRHLGRTAPSTATIGRRLDKVYGKIEIVMRREGEAAANRMLESLGEPERPTRVMQILEIDETIADCFLVDEYGIPIGRPTLVLIVDVFSKMIVGVCITFRAPSTAVIMKTIKMAIMPKDSVLEGVEGIEGDWPCFGIPESIRTDNIRHYWSEALGDAFFDLSIEQEHSKVRKPKGKATVERKFLTTNITHLNRLPGYVEEIRNRILDTGLDPEKNAILTLKEFKEHMFRWIVNDNNYKKTSGLNNRRPIDVWNESAEFYVPRLDRPLESLDVTLLAGVGERTIQSGKGVGYKSTHYSSPELMRLRAQLMDKKLFRKGFLNPSVKFRFDSDNLGYICVQDPITLEYFKVWTNDESYHGLSEPLYKCAKELQALIRKQDGKYVDVAEAVCLTKSRLVEMVGGKHKVAHRKKMAALKERMEQKEIDSPFVEEGIAFAERINKKVDNAEYSTNSSEVDLDFGPSSYLED
ncbi:hypothetical protein A9Q81_08220 [Gammaproteobacteria bacterium 42_54_T18]|nr:hypothetical protein A9Q81_08220 [Gammaproteobacteria bacterium 42_54_T18]